MRHYFLQRVGILFVSIMLTASVGAYDLIDLGMIGTGSVSGTSINNSGQVSGSRSVNSDTIHAFFHNGFEMLDLGVLKPTDINSYGRDINNVGQIVGWSEGEPVALGRLENTAFLYENGELVDLTPLFEEPCDESRAFAINDYGQIAGNCTRYYFDMWGQYSTYGFFYDGNSVIMLTEGYWGSNTNAINNYGQVTGIFDTLNGLRAFLFDGEMHDLGTLGGASSGGRGINDLGQVTGYSRTAEGAEHAFFYDGNTMHDLGAPEGGSSMGIAINENGHIVGRSRDSNGESIAWFYDGESMRSVCELTDCTSKGWTTLLMATDINDYGDIAGYGLINGETHAFYAASGNAPFPIVENCVDGIDNDNDGLVDCDDTQDCAQSSNCYVPPQPEICDDGIDNDGDGLIDCLDKKDCRQHPACKTSGGGGGNNTGGGNGGGKNR